LPDEEIYVIVREEGSGTRGTFEEYTMDPWDYTVDTERAHELPSNPAVRGAVETTSYSVGYVGSGFLSSDMVHVALARTEGAEYVLPTLANIEGGKFPISRFLYFVTSNPPLSGSLVDRFIDFVLSSEGQQLAESKGFLKLPPNHNYP
jgi:phosphate transport system substrate-binding protein